jgi:hypothetical protein
VIESPAAAIELGSCGLDACAGSAAEKSDIDATTTDIDSRSFGDIVMPLIAGFRFSQKSTPRP